MHPGQVYLRPAQVAVLKNIIGFGCRTQDFVGDGEQQRPQQHEPFGMFVGAAHGTVTVSFAGCSGRLPPLSQRYHPGLAASRRIPQTVPLQTASLIDAATRPPIATFTGVSSGRASWMVPYERPMLTHCPVNAWLTTAGGVPAMRLSTVLAAWAPSGIAAWQLIRNGWPDGAAASPAATMRGSSMLVSVSSVSSRPSSSVQSPLRAAS